MHLASFDTATFLRDHWQQRPLLIRNPWAAWANPLEPDELAGLACEDGIEARLVVEKHGRFKLEHGPFTEKRFAKLGKHPWTLLVQAVNHHVPEVAALLEPFRFVPNWRIDDVMVSLAGDGGGVGPHFDQYDVFLVQGLGRRRWRVGGRCDEATPLQPNADLRLLADFEATDEWVLEPGDILYVPPGFAHEGVAVGDDCMTYSIGFRAPSRAELVAGWTDEVLDRMGEDDRYGDPGLSAQGNPGEIVPAALDRLHAMVTEALADRAGFARWFGRYNSERKNPEVDWTPEEPVETAALRARLATRAVMVRNPASRFSFVRHGADAVSLFVDGECFECDAGSRAFAEALCAHDRLEADPAWQAGAMAELIKTLIDQGSVAFDD